MPEQLLSFAQLVDTALFRAYLVVRPGLVGSLCRIENWCEVGEVEEELRARQVRVLACLGCDRPSLKLPCLQAD